MSKKDYEKRLEEAYNKYIATVEAIAEEARQKYLIPYCKKHNYEFVAGNGTFYIYNPKIKGRATNDPIHDRTPQRIIDILEIEIHDNGNPCLAEFMLDVKG